MLTYERFSVCGREELNNLRTKQSKDFFTAQGQGALAHTEDALIARLNLSCGPEIHLGSRTINRWILKFMHITFQLTYFA